LLAKKVINAHWVVPLTPYLDQNAAWDRWSNRDSLTSRPDLVLPFLLCPSDPEPQEDVPFVNYVVNCGRYDPALTGIDTREAAVFHNLQSFIPKQSRRRVNVGYLTDKDGASNTAILSENVHPPETGPSYPHQWRVYVPRDDNGTPDDPSDDTLRRPIREYDAGMVWWPDTAQAPNPPSGPPHPACRINGQKDNPPAGSDFYYAIRPASHHPGGVIMSFGDARQKFISETINYHTNRQLMAPDDNRAGVRGILDPGSY
jgi:hypothetical protein